MKILPKSIKFFRISNVVILIAIIILINLIFSSLYARIDLTQDKRYTLTKETSKVVKSLNDVLTVNVYITKNLPPELQPVEQGVRDLLEEYTSLSNFIQVKYIDPDSSDEIRSEIAQNNILEKTVTIIRKDQYEEKKYYLSLVLLYEDQKKVIDNDNARTLEYSLTTAIHKMTDQNKMSVGFLYQQGEKSIEYEYSAIKQMLDQQYEVGWVTLDSLATTDLLFIAGPKTGYSQEEAGMINNFLQEGGKAIFLVDRLDVSPNSPIPQVLENPLFDLIEQYGIEIKKNLVLDGKSSLQVGIEERVKQGVFEYTKTTPVDYPLYVRAVSENFDNNNPVFAGVEELYFPFISSLDILDPVYARIIGTTTDGSWIQNEPFNLSLEQQAPLETNVNNLIAIYEDENTKFMVIGDSDFLTNDFNPRTAPPFNYIFIFNAIDWALDQGDFTKMRSREIDYKSIKEVDYKERTFIKYLNVFGVSALVILLGIIKYIIRKKRKIKI